jgi:hypothetical protein
MLPDVLQQVGGPRIASQDGNQLLEVAALPGTLPAAATLAGSVLAAGISKDALACLMLSFPVE